jgi:hypothetical protein
MPPIRRLIQVFALVLLWVPPGLTVAAPPPRATAAVAASYGGPFVRACGSNQDSTQTSASGSFQDLGHCTLTLTENGAVLVLANASAGLVAVDDSYEAIFRLDHNSGLTGDIRTERVVDAYPDDTLQKGGNGTDRNVALTGVYTVTAGVHTFALLWRLGDGSGPMKAVDATLSVLFIPDSTDLQLCGYMQNGSWPNNTTTYFPTAKCTLNMPSPGIVFVSADGWLKPDSPSSPPYEAAHLLVVDGDTSSSAGVRYTDVYTNTSNGVNTTVANTRLFEVPAGQHEFTLMQKRQSGSGQVRMFYATLAALYVPVNSPYVQTCSGLGSGNDNRDTTSYVSFTACQLRVPANSWAFISGTSSVGLAVGGSSLEARFGLAVDGLLPLSASTRYINTYDDDGDGLDGSMAVSLLTPLLAGSHTLNLVGERYSGSGAVRAHFPALFALAPAANLFLPLAVK